MEMIANTVLSSSWAVLTILAAILIVVGWWALSRPVAPSDNYQSPQVRENERWAGLHPLDRWRGEL